MTNHEIAAITYIIFNLALLIFILLDESKNDGKTKTPPELILLTVFFWPILLFMMFVCISANWSYKGIAMLINTISKIKKTTKQQEGE